MPQVKPVIEPHVKRVVIGVGPGKKSAAIHRDSPNHQEVPGTFGAPHSGRQPNYLSTTRRVETGLPM